MHLLPIYISFLEKFQIILNCATFLFVKSSLHILDTCLINDLRVCGVFPPFKGGDCTFNLSMVFFEEQKFPLN